MSRFNELRIKNLELTRKAIQESINQDLFIINAVNNLEELQRQINTFSKRLKEWYALYLPELEKKGFENETFISLVLQNDKPGFIARERIKVTMGANLKKEDLDPILSFAKSITHLIDEEKILREYVDIEMKKYCPNTATVAGGVIGAKLLRGAGSLRRLAMMRSSTVQLIGAEKALFRHIRTGARPPKYGYLLQHPVVQKAKKEDRGRAARTVADKIFVAVRLDYFKGKFMGDELLREAEEKFR
jgi:nucleolar protein 56